MMSGAKLVVEDLGLDVRRVEVQRGNELASRVEVERRAGERAELQAHDADHAALHVGNHVDLHVGERDHCRLAVGPAERPPSCRG